jgi:hypothetical protein
MFVLFYQQEKKRVNKRSGKYIVKLVKKNLLSHKKICMKQRRHFCRLFCKLAVQFPVLEPLFLNVLSVLRLFIFKEKLGRNVYYSFSKVNTKLTESNRESKSNASSLCFGASTWALDRLNA